jgi:phage terminase large subunit-like protein
MTLLNPNHEPILSEKELKEKREELSAGYEWEGDWLLPGSKDIILPTTNIIEGNDLDARLNRVDYNTFLADYRPSLFALEFVNFIKLVNGEEGEENESPIIHYDMLDQVIPPTPDPDDPVAVFMFLQNLYVSFRGSAKTTALHEYMILYLATFGKIPNFGEVNVGIYISDTMDNGVKSMRTNLQFRWDNSDFLQEYVPKAKFTDVRWEFENADKKKLCFRGFGASTGVRGFKEYGQRPTWGGFDDLMSDKNAESPTIQKDIKHIIYKAARQALHPKKRMQIWTGTPFNKSDPLYEAASSGAWNTRVYPICHKFPVPKAEFQGGWPDRFPYEFVKNEYDSLILSGEIASFNQELMLRITSDEDRLVQDSDLVWYNRDQVIKHKARYNFYITSDLTTSNTTKADYAVICVWAYSNNGDWLLVDGLCKRQKMDASMNALFRFVSVYRPLEVGIEINGQQQGFIQWMKGEMVNRNIFFNFAGKGSVEGIRRSGRKIDNFKLVVPLFSAKKIWLPNELKNDPLIIELLEEIRYATSEEFKSKHDDVADTISMLLDIEAFKPSAVDKAEYTENEAGTFAWYQDDDDDIYKNSTVF